MREYLIAKFRISNDQTIIAGLISQERQQIKKNREVLKRMIDVTLFLAKQGLAFRGHRENYNSSSGERKQWKFS